MTITISNEHARVLIAALDHYSRMGMGQLWTVAETLATLRPDECPDRYDMEVRFIEPMQLEYFKKPINASDGICSAKVPDSSKIAYDLQCVIRAEIAKTENHSKSSVWHGPPLHTCKKTPLAVVSRDLAPLPSIPTKYSRFQRL